ncbi:MAG TPA: D-aminoacyl-tRNA deacylase [Jiangellaceae bacterium]|nr:D-aminoacyl-tRNA deacylase [Jiangellaceae bacterium]
MRAVVQRVRSASVSVDGMVVGSAVPSQDGQGLLVLVGVTHEDTSVIAASLAAKVWGLRILDGERSASDVGAPVLVVSQFTLYGNTGKGRRPSWGAAAPREIAEPLVEEFVTALRNAGAEVGSGVFGAQMHVESVNDGPVTVLLELPP